MTNKTQTSMSSKLRRLNLSAENLSALSRLTKIGDFVQTEGSDVGVDMSFVMRAKKPKRLFKFMSNFGLRSLVMVKLTPGVYTFKARTLFNDEITTDVEITENLPYKYHVLKALEDLKLEIMVNHVNKINDSKDKIRDLLDKVSNIDSETIDVPDDVLEQISVLEDQQKLL